MQTCEKVERRLPGNWGKFPRQIHDTSSLVEKEAFAKISFMGFYACPIIISLASFLAAD